MNRQDLGSDPTGGQDAGSVFHRCSHQNRTRGSPRVCRVGDAGDGRPPTSGSQAAVSVLTSGVTGQPCGSQKAVPGLGDPRLTQLSAVGESTL